MDPRLFAEWAQIDDHLRRAISARDEGQLPQSGRGASRERQACLTGDLLCIVSRADARTYTYLKDARVSQRMDVIADRRIGDRRRVPRPTTPDRRNRDRR